ncbi:MAG: hypothetical protein Q8O71_01050 [bacterium]|nr:hypothetical protein [bacterium]
MNQSRDIKNAKIWGTITAVFLAGILFFFFQTNFSPTETQSPLGIIDFSAALTNDNTGSDSIPVAESENMSEGKTHKDSLGFSFIYPKDWTVGRFAEGEDGTIVIVQNPEHTNGFQVYATPFTEEDTTLTPERLLNEIPDLVIEESQQINVSDGGTGITFLSDNGSGKTREVWFIHGGYLYQFSSPLSTQNILQEVLKTWKF